MTQSHSPMFQRMRSLDFKMERVRDSMDRIRRVVAHEQLAAAAMLPPKTRLRQRRIQHWADVAQRVGWPDGYRREETPVLEGEVIMP